jgi:uncharacterized membrane protein YqjE
MTDVRTPPPSATEPIEADKNLSELVSQLTSDFSSLVTTHIELAKVEIKEEVTKAGKGAGMLGGGAFAAVMAVLLLSFAAAWGLAEVMAPGWAFLIVGVVWAGAAAFLALTGKQKLAEARMPEQTIEEVKEDAQWVRQQTS